jgi:putative ABC transport system permease protein
LSFSKIALRNIPRRKLRNTLTLIAVVLGVSLLIGVNIAAASGMSEFTKYINKTFGEVDIYIRHATGARFDLNDSIQKINTVAGIASYTYSLGWSGNVNNDSKENIGLLGINTTQDSFVYPNYEIRDGQGNAITPPALNGTFAVATKDLCSKYGATVGDRLNIAVQAYNSSYRNQAVELVIIGIYNPTQRGGGEYLLIDLTLCQNLSGLVNKISLISIKVGNSEKTGQVKGDLKKVFGPDFDVVAPKEDAEKQIQGMTSGFQIGLTMMTTVSLVVCAFLIFNTMFMSISERTYEIGILRSLGSSRRQIFIMFFNEALFLGLIGTIVGVVLGLGMSKLFLLLIQMMFNLPEITSFILTPAVIFGGFAAGLVTVLGGALYPAFSACRVSVIRALRPGMRVQNRKVSNIITLTVGVILFVFGAIQVLRIIPYLIQYVDVFFMLIGAVVIVAIFLRATAPALGDILSPLSKSLGKLVSRNVGRKMLRNTVCFGIIGISLSFIVMIGGVEAGTVTAMEEGVRSAVGADLLLISNQTEGIPNTFVSNLSSVEGVDAASPVSAYWLGTHANDRSVGVVVIDPVSFSRVMKYDFVSPSSPEQVYNILNTNNESLMLPQSLADELNVSFGQNVSILTGNGTRVNFTVAGIFVSSALQFINMGRPLSESVFISFNSQKAHFYGNYVSWLFFVNVRSEYKSRVGDVLQNIDSAYPQYGFKEHSTTIEDILSMVRLQINRIFSILFLILYFAVLIATLGIAVTMIMNATERKREIGILRSQGMSGRQILVMFLLESIVIGVTGFCIGVPCGIILLSGTTGAMSVTGFWIPFVIPWDSIIQALISAVAAAIIGALYPAYKASKITIIDTLKQR